MAHDPATRPGGRPARTLAHCVRAKPCPDSRRSRSTIPTRSVRRRSGTSTSTTSTISSSAGWCSSPAGTGWSTSSPSRARACASTTTSASASRGGSANRLEDGTTHEIGPGMVYEIPPGHDGWVVGDEAWVAYDVAGVRSFARADAQTQRILGAVLFTDIVDSTALAESMGPTRWRELVGHAQRADPVRAGPVPGPAREDDGRRRARPVRRVGAGRPRSLGDLPGRASRWD